VEKGFGLLAGGDRLAAERHQTLAATAEWSYRLLGEGERAVFRRLAVLPGAFTLEAAEAVAGQDAGPAVLHLVDCSLLVPPRPDPDGRVRYLMLQTLRGYALDLLAASGPEAAARWNESAGRDEGWAARAGLAGYALRVAEQAAAGMRSSASEVDAARWLDAEDGVVHQALGWALECDPATAVRLALALAPWWAVRGRQASGYRLLTAAAALTPPGGPQWCAAQVWLGQVAVGSSESARLGHFTAAKDVLAGQPPSSLLVRSLIGRAGCLANLESAAAAEQEARQALTLAREIGDQAGQARALRLLGLTAFYDSDTERSLEWLRQALRIDPAAIPGAALRECITMLTAVLLEAGELAEARHYGTRALALARQAGAVRDQANGLMRLAHVGLVDGRLTQAAGYLSEAIELASRTGGGVLLIDCLEICAHLCAQTRRPADALTAWAAYAACLADSGLYDLPQDQRLREAPQREARRRLGPEKARAAERRGAAMGLATATEYATMLVTAELEEAPPEADMARLSVREQELLTLVAQGHTNTQIAGRLYISVRTVGSHLDRIRDKTGCRRRADLTRLALQAGLV
jgi:DNA-binding CsgD family transcriptional regulator/tetratricopeptide (TPR) repeat protein